LNFGNQEKFLSLWDNGEPMGIFGKRGPKTSLGTMNRIVEGDGRKKYNTQTSDESDEIFNLSSGIFGRKRRK
jgi:hypothetical protein